MNIKISKEIFQDAVNLKNGVYAPLFSFLRKDNFNSVLNKMRLADRQIWSIPIIITINKEKAQVLRKEKKLKLAHPESGSLAVLNNIEIYPYSKSEYCEKVFGTLSLEHPGVKEVMNDLGDYILGGDVSFLQNYLPFNEFFLTPKETKQKFKDMGWRRIAAFQTRNVPHRGHEYIQKKALENTDGLFIQPIIGSKKSRDVKDEYILSAYDLILQKYFPAGKTLLGALPAKMHYAGPREALTHALIRKNYGCTHFIVGRDHAGVGDFYDPKAAQDIFDQFGKEELGIKILKYSEVVYDKRRKEHGFIDEIKHSATIKFSGTKVREYIQKKKKPPVYLLRPEIYDFLINAENIMIDDMYKKENNNKKGFVLWLTGLSAAGKTTIADLVFAFLNNNGNNIERLDGDIVRENLSRDLDMSKKGRDENIRRIGFVANLLSRNNIGVIASFISPYKEQRDSLRALVSNYIEVFVDAPLSVCEKRDPKGMYQKARKGQIRNFTGINDPYEAPEHPDIHLRTDIDDVDKCALKIIEYLKKNKYIK